MRKVLLGTIVGGVLLMGLANAQGGDEPTTETSYPPVPPLIVSPPTPEPGEHPPAPVEAGRPI